MLTDVFEILTASRRLSKECLEGVVVDGEGDAWRRESVELERRLRSNIE